MQIEIKDPLSGFAASPWKGDDALAARRLLLGVFGVGARRFYAMWVAHNAMDN